MRIHEIPDGNENCSYPWNKYKSEVKKIIIDDTITHIPEKAFTNCYHLLEINVPTQCIVAQNAFKNCFSLDIVKAINEIFGRISINDMNIQHLIENIFYCLQYLESRDFGELSPYLKQIYDIMKLKGNFVQLFTKFINLIMPLSYLVKSSDIKLNFNSICTEINKDNINKNVVIPSSIYYIIF